MMLIRDLCMRVQAEWREEVKQHFEKIKSEGTCLHRLDEELINRRREELRSETDTCTEHVLVTEYSNYSNTVPVAQW